MAALVNYGSSDEEDNLGEESTPTPLETEKAAHPPQSYGAQSEIQQNGAQYSEPKSTFFPDAPRPEPEQDTPLVGPVIGPTIPLDISTTLPELLEEDQEAETAPQSPYSANRALLRDLTLPTMPSYDIPPSPPSSPIASTNAKFKHFLELKKQGVHFNEKLARSSALKNPSLMQKLMDFSDIDELGQYATTLPKDMWDPEAFPDYAYKEELAKSQQKKREGKARGPRELVDFVPESASGEPISRSGTPGFGGKPSQKSAAERVMAGLDSGRSNSPHVQGVKRKTRFES